MTGREVAVIGVASSAGTRHAGQERAPAAQDHVLPAVVLDYAAAARRLVKAA